MEHERQALGGAERLEHDQQRKPDRFGELRFARGIVGGEAHQGLRNRVDRVFGAGLAGTQHVQADPADHGGQPRAQVLELRAIAAAEAKPALLHGILRVGSRAEHPVRDGPQVGAVELELLGERCLLVHVTSSRWHPSHE